MGNNIEIKVLPFNPIDRKTDPVNGDRALLGNVTGQICRGFDDQLDADLDNIPDGCDNCPTVANSDQADTTSDRRDTIDMTADQMTTKS